MHPQIRALMKQQITVEHRVGMDGRGIPSFGTPQDVKCYLAGENKMVRNVNGEEVVSNTTVYLSGTDSAAVAMTVTDRLTLPDGSQPPIIAIQQFYGRSGNIEVIEVNL